MVTTSPGALSSSEGALDANKIVPRAVHAFVATTLSVRSVRSPNGIVAAAIAVALKSSVRCPSLTPAEAPRN